MGRIRLLVLTAVVCAACAHDPVTTQPVVPPDQTAGHAETVTTFPPGSAASTSTRAETDSAVDDTPAYDIFLAAVAETLEGTRFDGAPFEDPEVFAATGLLFCERMAAGIVADEVVFEYLTELAGGDAALADGDQLVLAGALMGAATEAICPLEAG